MSLTRAFVFISFAIASLAQAETSVPRAKVLYSSPSRITLNYSTLAENFVAPGSTYRSENLKSSPLFISVQKSGLAYRDEIHFMFIQYQKSCYNGACQDVQSIEEGDLKFAFPGQFEGYSQYPITLFSSTTSGSETRTFQSVRQEIVIWINGEIVKDLTTSRNLSFDLSQF